MDANYRTDVAPFTRYRSDGERLRAQVDEGHQHVEEDVEGLPSLLGQLATDNAAALTASSHALIAANNAAEDAAEAQQVASAATAAANAALSAVGNAAAAAGTAQRTADGAVSAAVAAQSQVDALASDVSAATQTAARASDVAAHAQSDVDEVAGAAFVVVGAAGITPQARQLAAGSRMVLEDGGPGGALSIEARTDVATQFTAGQAIAFVDLVGGPGAQSHVAWDASQSNNARLVLANDAVLDNPTGLMGGQELRLRVSQAEPGGFALTYGSKYRWAGGLAPVLPVDQESISLLTFLYDDFDDILLGRAELGYAR